MTTLEIIRQRVDDLRTFFKARFGYGWQMRVKERAGMDGIPTWFRDSSTLNHYPYVVLPRFEAIAVRLGYKLGGLDRPFERKTPARRKQVTSRLEFLPDPPVLIPENAVNDAQAEHNTTSDAPPIVDSTPLATPQQGT